MVWLSAGAPLEGSRRLQDMYWRFSVLPLFESAENTPETGLFVGRGKRVASGCKTLASRLGRGKFWLPLLHASPWRTQK